MLNAYEMGNSYPNNGYQNQQRQNYRMPTKAEQLKFLIDCFDAKIVERVGDFETNSTRHACLNERKIFKLGVILKPIPSPKGAINAECMYCSYCKKLIINTSSLA